MNPPEPFTVQALVVPPAVPVALIPEHAVFPVARKSSNHIAGLVKGSQADYRDLNAYAWYMRGGWEYRNGQPMRRRGLSGGEDVGTVKRT